MNEDIYVRPGSGLEPLEPVLETWRKLVHDFCGATGRDAPYWYNERANVGVLAAAAWKTEGGLALEEYASPKRHGQTRWKGRTDLWLQVGQSQYVVEAKIAWVSVTRPKNNALSTVKYWLSLAEEEAPANIADSAMKVGMVFVVPYLAGSAAVFAEERSVALQSKLRELKPDLFAAAFPESVMSLSNDAGYVYPGVFCIARKI